MIIPRQRLSCQAMALDKAITITESNIRGEDQPGWEISTNTRGLILLNNRQKANKQPN